MGISTFICSRILPAVVLTAAVVVGWILQQDMPLATLFACIFPVMQGHLPPPVFGHGKMEGTPPVPDDFKPLSRPDNEMFLDLPGGHRMPQNGLGMCCRASAYDDVLVRRSVLWYLLQGGRHIDGAHLYLNHKAIGLGIRDAMERGIPREEIFVTTKIFPSHFGYQLTLDTAGQFTKELGLDYIDLVLMHFPAPFGAHMLFPNQQGNRTKYAALRGDTWKALSELRGNGLFRNVGVSNFAVWHLEELANLLANDDNLAPVANNQIHFSPWTPAHVTDTLTYCRENGIAVTGYSSLGGTMHHAEAKTVEVLQGLASKYSLQTKSTISVAQIILRWVLQVGAAVIPGTGNPSHMRENLAIYDFELTEEDMTAINALKHDEKAQKFFYMDPPTV